MVPCWSGSRGLVLGFAAGFLYRKAMAASNAQSIEARRRPERKPEDAPGSRARGRRDPKRPWRRPRRRSPTMRREAEEDVRVAARGDRRGRSGG